MEAGKRTHLCWLSILSLCIAWIAGVPLSAQAVRPPAPTYSLAGFHRLQGLVVRTIVQDSRGYVWLGTDDGLWRSTSGGFQRLDLGSSIIPPVRCLLEAPSGTLWVGTQEGLVAFDTVTLELRTDTLLPGTRVIALAADSLGRVWVGSLRGVYRLERDGPSPTATLIDDSERYVIFSLLADEGELLAGTFGRLLRIKDDHIVEAYRDALGPGSAEALLRDDEGSLWVGMRNPGGLYRISGDAVRQFDEREGLDEPEINVLLRRPDGEMWVATEDGIYRYADGTFHEFLSRDDGLPNPDVHALMVDFERQVWIGTYGGGAYRLRSPYVLTYGVETGLAHPFVTAAAWARDGRLILGTVRGAQVLRPEGSGMEALETNMNVTAVYVDRGGEVWIGEHKALVRGRDGKRFPTSRVYAFAEDVAGRLLVATDEGLWRLENEHLVPVAVPPAVSGAVQDVHVLPDGAMLLGTNKGLARGENGSVRLVLPEYNVRVIEEGPRGRFWLGTRQGLVIWDASTGEARVREGGTLNCRIRDIVRVRSGDMWLACDTGLVRPRDGRPDRFGTEYGLPSPDVRALAYDGATGLYAGTTQGLVRIDTDRLIPCPARPRLVIREVTAGTEEFAVGHTALALPFRQRDVVIEMENLGWQSAVGSHYTFRLRGLIDTWSTPLTQTFARFASLPPGDYEFQAKSKNERGMESEIATVSFSVLMPFWRRPWFLAILCVLGLGLAVLALRAYRRRRQLQRAAEEAALVKSEFISRMSHEIRTPLTAILASAELLSDRQADPAQSNVHVRSIVRNGRHLLALINDILDLSKLNKGRMEPDLAPVDLDTVLDEVRSVAVHRADGKPITISIETMPDVPTYIVTDATKLRQILFNLMDNAVRFTREGAVRMEVMWVGGAPDERPTLRFAVTDTGVGVRLEERESVFQAFRQADSSIRRRYGGTGLGLTIAKSLAELLGGRLTMESLAGTGTTFVLALPVEVCDAPPPSEQRLAPFGEVRLDDVDVLLADDSEDTRRVLRLVLEQFGARVVCVPGGDEAVEAAAGRPFNVILLDIHMPETDGIEALRRLHERSIDTPMIAITADATKATAKRCLEAGFDAFVTKPFDSADLAAIICKALGRKPLERRAKQPATLHPAEEGESPAARSGSGPIESTIASISPALAGAAAEFATALAADVRSLNEALSRSDRATIGDIAHRLKGSGGTNGYPVVSDVAVALEAALQSADMDTVAARVRELAELQRRMMAGIRSGLPQSP